MINTRFRVTVKIENTNPFPMGLSSFNHELYGNGLFWADGTEMNLLNVPANSSVETNLFLIMNFINMNRNLLDQVARLENVSYRFVGNAVVGTGIEYLPGFTSSFNLSGITRVISH